MTLYAPDPLDFKEMAKGPLIASGETFKESYKALTSTNKYRTTYYQAQEKSLPSIPATTKTTTAKTTDAAATAATEAAKIEADNLNRKKSILASSQSSDDNGLLTTRKTAA